MQKKSRLTLMIAMMIGLATPLHATWQNALKPKGLPGPELTLAQDGDTDYVIVVPKMATTQDWKAAVDLKKWLNRMTGANFPIITDAAATIETEISVGRTNRLEQADIPSLREDLGKEGYAIGVEGKRLYLVGGTMRGPIYAVYALLEEDLGCRWYHKKTTEIPDRPTLTFRPITRHYVPVMFVRDPFYYDAFDRNWSLHNRTNSPRTQFDADQYPYCGVPDLPEEWGGRPIYVPGFVHTFYTLLPPDEYFEDHPEYYQWINGGRTPGQICQTHPEVIRIVTERVFKYLEDNPKANVVEISPNDSSQYCQCDDCETINQENDSPAGSLIYFVNQIAAAIEQDHPDVIVSTLAYLSTIDAPSQIKPRDNVTIRLCNDLHAWRYPLIGFQASDYPRSVRYRKAIVEWSKICDNLSIWDYTVNFSHYMAPLPNLHLLASDMDFYVAHNVKSIMWQGAFQSSGGERAPLRCWVLAKMAWDPSLDVEELTRDFVWGYFKSAAPPIMQYYDLLEQVRQENLSYHLSTEVAGAGIRYNMDTPMFSEQFMRKATELFEQAQALAGNDEIRRRVQLEKLPILYVKLRQGPEVTGDEYGQVLEEFQQITRNEDVFYLSDQGDGPGLNNNIKAWREQLDTFHDNKKSQAKHERDPSES